MALYGYHAWDLVLMDQSALAGIKTSQTKPRGSTPSNTRIRAPNGCFSTTL